MTDEEKRSAIKKLNERYTDIARAFGPQSAITKEYETALRTVFGSDALHPAKTSSVNLRGRTKAKKAKDIKVKKQTAASMGLSLVSRDRKTLDRVNDKELEAMLRKQTAGQIKRDVKEEARKESEESGVDVTPEDVLEAMDYVYEIMADDNPEFYEACKFYWENIGGKGQQRPSYTLLQDIMEGIKKADSVYQSGQKEEAHEIEAQLREKVKLRKIDDNYRWLFT